MIGQTRVSQGCGRGASLPTKLWCPMMAKAIAVASLYICAPGPQCHTVRGHHARSRSSRAPEYHLPSVLLLFLEHLPASLSLSFPAHNHGTYGFDLPSSRSCVQDIDKPVLLSMLTCQ